MNTRSILLGAACLVWIGGMSFSQVPCKTEEAKIYPPDGAYYDYFGWACSIDGDTAVVGSRMDDSWTGSAHVFTRSGTTWSYAQKLVASDGQPYDQFSYSLDLSGDVLVLGAQQDDDLGAESGSAYVFRRSGGTWSEEAKLLASDGAPSDLFGYSVAVEGTRLVVGARYMNTAGTTPSTGAAYIFEYDGAAWIETAKLVPSDGQYFDWFGCAVAMSGDWIAVGAQSNAGAGHLAGAAYLYKRNGSTWTEMQKILGDDTSSGDQFGISLSMSGDALVVGARFADTPHGIDSGEAYVFRRSGTSWSQVTALLPVLGPGDDFGFRVAIDGSTIVVGARFDDTAGSNRGAIYTYPACAGSWYPFTKVYPCALFLDAAFGTSVAISGESILIGAPQDVGAAVTSGSAYVYRVPPVRMAHTYCAAKVNSCGGLPAIGFLGSPSASMGSGFLVFAEGTRAGKAGLLIYTDQGAGSQPFQGGTLCLKTLNPLRSTPIVDTTGTPGMCDGRLEIDMNRFAVGGLGGSPSPVLRVAGTRIHAQFWGRDTLGNSLLSDAMTYLICP